MLETADIMYRKVVDKLFKLEENQDLRDEIYELDIKINELEKAIRKRIMEHLTLCPTIDLSTSLILMSVVKDAERLGDYIKNIMEVTELFSKPLDKKEYIEFFNNIDQDISKLFHITIKAFVGSDEEKAENAWNFEKKISKKTDSLIETLASSKLKTNKAVCYTLLARHYKRITSHLTNIATSVILPLSEIDFYQEDVKDQ
jgi:phosphate uptake regulator